jgi:hypothetical protein
MVFEGQSQFRKAQNMAALLAIIILIGVILPIPIGAGFADWVNEVNAPVAIDDKYTEISTFDFDSAAIYSGSGYKGYFYWWNASGTQNKHNVTMVTATHNLTANHLSKDDDNTYNNANGTLIDDYEPQWTEGRPYWEVYFNFTATDAYEDNVVRIRLVLESPNTLSVGAGANEKGNWTISAGGKSLISTSDDAGDIDDRESVSVALTAGGVTFYETTLSATGDGEVDINVTVATNDLRQAIMNGGAESFFKLKVTGHDIRPIEMDGSAFYSYNVARLFGRDDGLYLVSMISVICAALGIFLVQPRYTLPIGRTGRRRGF